MLKLLKIITLLSLVILASCEREKFKEYYERPSTLEPPIYENLQAKGKFKSYLKCVDMAGYTRLLAKTGFMTILAPTDSAFDVFLKDRNLTSVDQLDTATVKAIVAYSVIQDEYTSDQLDDYQSSSIGGWVKNVSFKRKTSFYKWVYSDTLNGQNIKVIDANAVGFDAGSSSIVSTDNNNKNIPFFTTNFLATRNLTVSDYKYFFPNAEFNGFNVVDANLVDRDIWSENGIIHVVNKVILPLPNLDDYLSSDTSYSMFRGLLDSYSKRIDDASGEITLRYQQNVGHYERLYQKLYDEVVFAPNSENFMRYGGGEMFDTQIDGWTLFVPTNNAIRSFFQSKFLKHFGTLSNAPPAQVLEFLNAHMFRATVWPSKFSVTQNYFGEEARFDTAANVVDKKMCSNGIFYGVNKIQETDVFYTMLGDVSLDTTYSLMLQALKTTQYYYLVKNPILNLQVILLNNAQIRSLGLNFNYGTGVWEINNPTLGTNAATVLQRIMDLHIFLNKNINLAQRGYVESYGGEYIRFQYVSANLGTTMNGPGKTSPRIKLYNTSSNGITYIINPSAGTVGDPLTFNIDNVGAKIESPATSAFGEFYRYLEKSAKSLTEGGDGIMTMNGFIYDINTKAITGVKITENTTIFIPNNAAMKKAVTDGFLPAITVSSFSQAEQEIVQKFINYHILSKIVLVPDGSYNGQAATHYSTPEGPVYVNIINTPPVNPVTSYGTIQVFDALGRVAKTTATVPTLSNRAILIQVDNYLRYE